MMTPIVTSVLETDADIALNVWMALSRKQELPALFFLNLIFFNETTKKLTFGGTVLRMMHRFMLLLSL